MNRRLKQSRRRETRDARSHRYNNIVRFPPIHLEPANDPTYRRRNNLKYAALAGLFSDKDRYVFNRDIPVVPSVQSYEADGLRRRRERTQRALYQGVLDRRRFYIGAVPPVARIGTRPNTELKPLPAFSSDLARLAFSVPHEVLTCIRRKQRKQVLFAKRKAGKSGQKKPKWNDESYIRC